MDTWIDFTNQVGEGDFPACCMNGYFLLWNTYVPSPVDLPLTQLQENLRKERKKGSRNHG